MWKEVWPTVKIEKKAMYLRNSFLGLTLALLR